MPPTPEMHTAVEREAKCRARYETAQTVIETILGDDFSRHVETYRLEGHESARAFIWRVENNTAFRIVFSKPGIVTAEDAMKSRARQIEKDIVTPD